ncbi:MAG: GntR family transcriptional regulator [Proteobacteria bacterium]|nr:GntR family transcriptional regulator [Pseudomonadota bacterium]
MVARRLVPDRNDATPLYIQVANGIREIIRDGSLDVGGALPSERTLSELTGASRVTIRKAIHQLAEEGLLLRRHGSGTYVAPRIEQHSGDLTSFSADAATRGEAPGSIWIVKALSAPTEEEAAILAAAPTTLVARLGRVRLADGQPLAIEHAVVPAELLPGLDQIQDSLYAALAMKGNRPFRGEQRLRASTATSVEAGLLSMEEGGEILRIERRTFLEDGRPVELTRSAYRGDRYTFVTELRELRPGGGLARRPPQT